MNKFLNNPYVIVGLTFLGVFSFGGMAIGLAILAGEKNQIRHREQIKQIVKDGHDSYDLGVPAEANPYIGVRYKTDESVAWLTGWKDAAKENAEMWLEELAEKEAS